MMFQQRLHPYIRPVMRVVPAGPDGVRGQASYQFIELDALGSNRNRLAPV